MVLRPGLPLAFLSSSVFCLELPCHCSPSFGFCIGLFLLHLPLPVLLRHPTSITLLGFGGTCMSQDTVESLSLKLDFLSARVTELEEEVKFLRREAARSATLGTYSVVAPSVGPASSAGDDSSVASNGYNQLALTIPEVPEEVVRACSLLSGGKLGARARATRAWQAGHWARFCLEGKLSKPRPTTPIDLANQYYVILRAEGFSCPILCDKASDYRYIIQDFKSGSLSHGFPSKSESWVYAKAAGFALPAQPYRWSSSN